MNYYVTGEQLTAVADAIRTKTGGSSGLAFPDGFTGAISGIHAIPQKYEHQSEIPFWSGTVIVQPGESYKFCYYDTEYDGILVEIVSHPFPSEPGYAWTINSSENAVYVTNNTQSDLAFLKSASTYGITVNLVKAVLAT